VYLGLAEGMFMVGWGVLGRVEGGGSLLRVGWANGVLATSLELGWRLAESML
jgi:hypothetical protein